MATRAATVQQYNRYGVGSSMVWEGITYHQRTEFMIVYVQACADPDPPTKNHKRIGFLNNTGLDHLKNHKLQSQHSMFGHHWLASETPFNLDPHSSTEKKTLSKLRLDPL